MTQEQCSHRNNVQSSEQAQVYKVGIYGWRKRCLYFFVLLLMILILVNLALTVWILKVMNFTVDGMGNLRITEKGLKLEGDSEFLQPLYAKEIQSKPGRPLYLQSSRNVSVNIVNSNNQLLTQLVTGSGGFKARGKMFEVKSTSGKLLFSADEQEVVVGAERLRVMGVDQVSPTDSPGSDDTAESFASKKNPHLSRRPGSRVQQVGGDAARPGRAFQGVAAGVSHPLPAHGGPQRHPDPGRGRGHPSHLQERAATGVQRRRDLAGRPPHPPDASAGGQGVHRRRLVVRHQADGLRGLRLPQRETFPLPGRHRIHLPNQQQRLPLGLETRGLARELITEALIRSFLNKRGRGRSLWTLYLLRHIPGIQSARLTETNVFICLFVCLFVLCSLLRTDSWEYPRGIIALKCRDPKLPYTPFVA
ncbi:delta-sarcoglycan isoform 2-T10 [Syngnathus typhle]